MSILLVEDDIYLNRVYLQYLSKQGHVVVPCGTLAEARAALKQSLADDVRTVICDMNLPDGQGVDLCLEIAPLRGDLHWVLISGAPNECEIEDKLHSVPGPRHWRVIAKPFSLRDMLTTAES